MSSVRAVQVDRRRTLRVPLGVQVDQLEGTAYAIDISAGGMCFQAATPPDPGTDLRLRFQLPGTKGIDVRARVIWTDCPGTTLQELQFSEVGVQFQDLDDDLCDAISRFVDERGYFWPESEA